MPIEQRVVSSPRPTVPAKPKITPRDRSAPSAPEPAEAPKKKGILKIVLASVFAVLLLVGLAFWLFVRPMLAGEPAEPVQEPGEVHTVESMNINLSDGHYLRLGFAVQVSTEAEEVPPARILDAAISLFSGQEFEDVLEPAVREGLKAQLANNLDKLFDGEVMDVWFIDYVAQ